jgi:hypothetical protein
MDAEMLLKIREILPDYDSLPNLLDAPTVYVVTGHALKPQTLAADRCGARRLGIGFIRVGGRIRYPKTEIAKWLLRSAVGVGEDSSAL